MSVPRGLAGIYPLICPVNRLRKLEYLGEVAMGRALFHALALCSFDLFQNNSKRYLNNQSLVKQIIEFAISLNKSKNTVQY